MNLTPLTERDLAAALGHFERMLSPDTLSGRAFGHIAKSAALDDMSTNTAAHRAAARALVDFFSIPALDGAPADAFSWDGSAVRVQTEASVLIHEVAHWQIAPPARRALPDFGLGAGPESGRKADADAACCVGIDVKAGEELLASLLGILWEAALGQPAVVAFVEQNWLEAWQRPAALEQFDRAVAALSERNLIGADGLPRGHTELGGSSKDVRAQQTN